MTFYWTISSFTSNSTASKPRSFPAYCTRMQWFTLWCCNCSCNCRCTCSITFSTGANLILGYWDCSRSWAEWNHADGGGCFLTLLLLLFLHSSRRRSSTRCRLWRHLCGGGLKVDRTGNGNPCILFTQPIRRHCVLQPQGRPDGWIKLGTVNSELWTTNYKVWTMAVTSSHK